MKSKSKQDNPGPTLIGAEVFPDEYPLPQCFRTIGSSPLNTFQGLLFLVNVLRFSIGNRCGMASLAHPLSIN